MNIRIQRFLMLLVILAFTCELGLRIRMAVLYHDPSWILYHQFKFRTEEEINTQDLPHYYKTNMFKPFTLIYKEEPPRARKGIITIESSALRSVRRQFEKIVADNPRFFWEGDTVTEAKEIIFSNNDVVLYELFVYPDVYNTLKREERILKKVLGATIDDFLYHNLAFYMHIDENINFTTLNSDKILKEYIGFLRSREEPLCKSIHDNGFKNIIYILLPNKFDSGSPGGRIYLKYINAAYEEIMPMLKKYNIPVIDLMKKKVTNEDFKDFFHFSKVGGRKMSYKILEYLERGSF